jgi:hypothetical protein
MQKEEAFHVGAFAEVTTLTDLYQGSDTYRDVAQSFLTHSSHISVITYYLTPGSFDRRFANTICVIFKTNSIRLRRRFNYLAPQQTQHLRRAEKGET